MDLTNFTLTQAVTLLKEKKISIHELYKSTVSSIENKNKDLNIFLSFERNINAPIDIVKLPLSGVPLAIKDNFLTQQFETAAASEVLKGFKPTYESTVTQRLINAGGLLVGKTNMDAWAHGSSTEHSDYGPTKNPRNQKYLPGGSSGGSAAAVAANMCMAAIGSETAGSIRQPASWCGVVGLKPTYGRVSRYGVVAMGSSLDSPGPMTKTVADAALLLEVIAGHDKYDGTTSNALVSKYTKLFDKGIKGMKVGVCYADHEKINKSIVYDALVTATRKFEELGAKVSMIKMGNALQKNKILNPDYAVSVYTIVQRSEVSSNLARYDGIRYGDSRSKFGDEAKRRIILGTFTLSKGYADKYYVNAQRVRSLYIENYSDLFETYDVLISPTSPGYAQPLGITEGNPMFGELEDLLLEPSSIAGLPGISIPMYKDEKTNLFLGLNIISDRFQEAKVLRVAHAYEQATSWNDWIR